ncbi:MAG: hypothetical protein J6S60_03895 [Oscillospiraceae bacterium]|nr:hypothetical protein [Oscillospiraceae bacterium]
MDNEKRRLYATEYDGLMQLALIGNMLLKSEERLANRLKGIKRGRFHMACARAHALKMYDAVLDTVPVAQLKQLKHNLDSASWYVGVKRPGETKKRDYGVWISIDALEVIEECLHDHCQFCPIDIEGQRRCALRRVLDTELTNNAEERPGGACPYMGVL